MPRYKVSCSVNLSNIQASRLVNGKKGQYVNLIIDLDTENTSEYGDHARITQSMTKQERENKMQMPIIGNGRVVWSSERDQGVNDRVQTLNDLIDKGVAVVEPVTNTGDAPAGVDDFDDDIPF